MYLFFDVETNGLPPKRNTPPQQWQKWPRLVQLGFVLYDKNKKLIKQYDKIIKPDGFIIPEAASNVHRITTEKAIKEGIDIVQVLNDFFDALDEADYLICHNFDFDYNVMLGEYFRNKIKRKSKRDRVKLCTMKASTDFCAIPPKYASQKTFKWPTLSELHFKLFGEDFEDAHDAMADIQATARCFWGLVDKDIISIGEDIVQTPSDNVQGQKKMIFN